MADRYLISDTLVAWYGSQKNGRKLQGLSIFTLTIDSLNPEPANKRFRDWLICSCTASGVTNELMGVGPSGHFDNLQTDYPHWFDAGNLIECPVWEFKITPRWLSSIFDVALFPAPGPDLGGIIKKLGI